MEASNQDLNTRVAELEKRMDEVETQIQSEVTGEVGKQQPRPVDVNTGQPRIESAPEEDTQVPATEPNQQPSLPPVSQPTPEPPTGAPQG